MSSDLGRTVVLDFDGDMLDVSVINPNRGTISERAPASAAAFDGEPLRIGYSATYLLDVLAHLGDESAVAHFDDAVSPAVFRTAESSSEIFVLMPCRV
jgi:DNA polymerase-3 subunit beta